MSGGVDSAVAAGLVADEGHDVIGVSMQLYDQRPASAEDGGPVRFGSCCSLDDLHDARRAAQALGVPHYIMNFERQFDAQVVQPFVDAYVSGQTPIPCSRCNSELKFSTLLERAGALGADALATGHYARVEYDEVGRRHRLRRGRDLTRDQSYFLFSLTQAQLARARFPVGDLAKADVREPTRTSAGSPWPTRPRAATSVSCPTATTPPSSNGERAPARRLTVTSSTPMDTALGTHRRRASLHRRSAEGPGRFRVGAAAMSFRSSPSPSGSWWARKRSSSAGGSSHPPSTGSLESRRPHRCACSRRSATSTPLRPATLTALGSDASPSRLRHAAARHRARPGRRLLRRRRGHRRRLDRS